MTQIENPLPACPDSPNCIRQSVAFNADSTTTQDALMGALRDMKAYELNLAESGDSIHAVFRIPVFGWKDDVDIAFSSDSDSTIVHIRSASREGYFDIFANKIRVRKLIKRTQKLITENS